MQISRGIIGNDSSESVWKMETRFTNPSILRVRIYIYIYLWKRVDDGIREAKEELRSVG